MNPIDYLDPTDATPHPRSIINSSSFYNKVIFCDNHKKFLDISSDDIVIMGIPESRNSINPDANNAVNAIRSYLYCLSANSFRTKIFDAGNLKFTKTPSDTYAATRDLTEYFFSKNIHLIILGGTQELTIPIYQGVSNCKSGINISLVDSRIDIGSDEHDFSSTGYLQKIVSDPIQKLFNLSIIGYQGYLTDSKHLDIVSKNKHEALRLGFVRGNFNEVEPVLRDSDIISFDMGAIRNSDCPGNILASPNGLYAEEGCQLARYSGLNERNKLFGIFEYNPGNDPGGQGAHLAAQLVWHYIEARNQKPIPTFSKNEKEIKKFIVNIGPPETELVFYKNLSSDSWWIEVPVNKKYSYPENITIIACSYSDYQTASKHEFPDRWFRFLSKLS